MAKKESTLVNMLVTLLVITAVASTALGFVYELTKEPKAAAELAKKTFAIKKVLPEYTNDPLNEMQKFKAYDDVDSLEFYPARQDGELTGVAIKTYTHAGYSGYISLMVGFKANGTIHNVVVMEQKETPGLGTKMTEPEFHSQFIGADPASFNLSVDDGGNVEAISGATISSKAYTEAVQRAYETYMNNKDKIN